jgi:glycine betaine catabolism B
VQIRGGFSYDERSNDSHHRSDRQSGRRSCAEYATDQRLSTPIRLVYSNRTVDDIIYREELETLQRDNPQFRILWTLTRPAPGTWTGRTGRVAGNGSTTLLAEAAADLKQPVYYLCGAPGFIEACLKSLVESGTPEAAIKFEVFRGYGAAA